MFQSRKFYYILFAVGALYVLLVQQFFKNEGRFIIQYPSYTSETAYHFEEDFQELNLPINKQLNLHGIWFQQGAKKGLVLLFPDADVDIRELKMNENAYYKNGFDVLISNYRGSGRSTGKLTNEKDLFSDAQNWYAFAKSQFSEDKIILVGQGFGGTVAANLAANNKTKALILEYPYYSYSASLSKSKFWWLPYSNFTSFPLNTWKEVRKTTNEIILIQKEEEKGKEKSLFNFLKVNDKAFWLENSAAIPYSNQAENAIMFKEILDSLEILDGEKN